VTDWPVYRQSDSGGVRAVGRVKANIPPIVLHSRCHAERAETLRGNPG
jgi:hypothetical protein